MQLPPYIPSTQELPTLFIQEQKKNEKEEILSYPTPLVRIEK